MPRLKREPRNRKYKPEFDWRDPDMPVIRRIENAWGISHVPVKPEDEQLFCQLQMKQSPEPHFKDDPTYALRIYKPKTYLRKLRKKPVPRAD